jgi:hypothetical protein
MLHVSGRLGEGTLPTELTALFDQYWQNAQTIEKHQAESYREVWKRKQASLHKLTDRYGDDLGGGERPNKPAIDSSVMSMSWKKFFDAVKSDSHHGFKKRCDLLERVKQGFLDYPSYGVMPDWLRKTIAGLPNREEPNWGWFGSNKGAFKFKHEIQVYNPLISQAIDNIPLSGTVTREQYNHYIEFFQQSTPEVSNGIATASRLLTLKRPDQFVTLNARNNQGLCDDVGIKKTGMTYERYWVVIERIMDTPWWNEPRPKDKTQARVWDGRVAMLDTIFYRPK